MESLPTEILVHVFEQFPKCEICQKNCLRTSTSRALSKCSNTCARWNKILEGDFQNVIGKCFPEFEDVISVTIDMKNARSWGLKLINWYEPFVTSRGMTIFSFNFDGIFSCPPGGLMALDGKIKGYKLRIATLAPVGDSILQVNNINLVGLALDEALRILKDVAENQKFRTVKLIVGKNVSIPSGIKVCKIDHI